MKFRIVNNLPAIEATLDAVARELDVVIPSCLANLLIARWFSGLSRKLQ